MVTINELNDILDIYKRIYPQIKNVHIKMVSPGSDKMCIGKCVMDIIGDFVYVGKMRYKQVIPEYIQLEENERDIIFTLLHEISHAITPYFERKVKDKWVIMDHSDKFYNNFLAVLDIGFERKLVDKKYDLKSLRQRDK